jgi:DNA-directed RNA polymerase specialized sigma24 family protein
MMHRPMTDEQLLEEYASTRSQAAFRQLVQRHAHWLYSASLRLLGDAQLAEDATQAALRQLVDRHAKCPGCGNSTPRPGVQGYV